MSRPLPKKGIFHFHFIGIAPVRLRSCSRGPSMGYPKYLFSMQTGSRFGTKKDMSLALSGSYGKCWKACDSGCGKDFYKNGSFAMVASIFFSPAKMKIFVPGSAYFTLT